MSQIIEVKVPDIGDFSEVPVIDLFVKVGDTIKIDDAIATLESDKATMDVPSTVEGVIKEVLVQLGSKVSEGAVLIKVEAGGAAAAAAAPQAAAPAPAAAAQAAAPAVCLRRQSHQQQRHGGGARNLLGIAAQEHARQASPPLGAQHDQAGAPLPGFVDHERCHLGVQVFQQAGFGLDALRGQLLAGLAQHGLGALHGGGKEVAPIDLGAHKTDRMRQRVDDVQQAHLRPQFQRQAGSFFQGLFRGRAAVEGNQDFFVHAELLAIVKG